MSAADLTAAPSHRRAALALALLLAACAALLCRPAASPAAHAKGPCSSAQAKRHARACAGRRGSTRARGHHARGKGKRHAKRRHARRGGRARHGSAHATPAPEPAVCEDGSRPVAEGEGSFSCTDGSEPVCANGAEPVAAKGGGKPVCPAPAAAGVEWSEAECEDGSAPERQRGGGGAGFACEDGSQPGCEDGSQPTPSDDGSMLVCLSQGSSSPSSPAGEGDEEGEEEAGAEGDALSARAASGS